MGLFNTLSNKRIESLIQKYLGIRVQVIEFGAARVSSYLASYDSIDGVVAKTSLGTFFIHNDFATEIHLETLSPNQFGNNIHSYEGNVTVHAIDAYMGIRSTTDGRVVIQPKTETARRILRVK